MTNEMKTFLADLADVLEKHDASLNVFYDFKLDTLNLVSYLNESKSRHELASTSGTGVEKIDNKFIQRINVLVF